MRKNIDFKTSETSVNFYQTTRRNVPEDSHLLTRRRENLKSHLILTSVQEIWPTAKDDYYYYYYSFWWACDVTSDLQLTSSQPQNNFTQEANCFFEYA
jgi:hypothetical protein